MHAVQCKPDQLMQLGLLLRSKWMASAKLWIIILKTHIYVYQPQGLINMSSQQWPNQERMMYLLSNR